MIKAVSRRIFAAGAALLLAGMSGIRSVHADEDFFYSDNHPVVGISMGSSNTQEPEETQEDYLHNALTLGASIMRTDATLDQFGSIFRYNGIVFGEFNGIQADTEGAMAIAGQATFGSNGYGFDVGSSAGHDNNSIGVIYDKTDPFPVLLLGDTFTIYSYPQFYGSWFMKQTLENLYETLPPWGDGHPDVHGSVEFVADDAVDRFFAGAKSRINALSDAMVQGSHLTVTSTEFINWKYGPDNKTDLLEQGRQTANPKIVVISVESTTDTITLNNLTFPQELLDYDLVVFNLMAENVQFGTTASPGSVYVGGRQVNTTAPISNAAANSFVNEVAYKIIWNCPETTTLSVNGHGVVGSVYAPNATVTTNGGSLNGRLVCENLTQDGGFELHNLLLRQPSDGDFDNDNNSSDPTGSVKLLKYETGNEGITLEGAVFDLEVYENGNWVPYETGLTTGSDGVITVNNLPYGSYRFVEKRAPQGYTLPASVYTEFTIDDSNGVTAAVERLVANDKITTTDPLGSVRLIKYETGNEGITLEGAVFDLEVYEKDDWVIYETGLTTGSDGVITVNSLPYGSYRFVEKRAPQGYTLPASVYTEFTIDDSNGVTAAVERRVSNDKITTTDPLGSVRLIKYETGDEGIALEGAVFDLEVYEKDDWVIYETGLTTGSNGVIMVNNLPYGSYRFVETRAPQGYVLPSSVYTEFTIDDSNGVTAAVERRVSNDKITTTDPLGSVRLIKYETGDETITLEGAVFDLEVYEKDDWVIYETGLTTGSDGVITVNSLPYGSYRFVEKRAPQGYVLPASVCTEFTIDDSNGVTAAVERRVSNDKITTTDPLGSVRLIKYETGDEGIALEGAVFDLEVYEKDDWVIYETGLTTGSNGVITVNNLPYGSYRFKETQAPQGYVLPASVCTEFTIDDSNGVTAAVERRVSNDKITTTDPLGSVRLIKYETGDEGIALEGAVFDLEVYEKGGWITYQSNLTTDGSGVITVNRLPYGSYRFKETQAPQGYVLPTSVYTEFTIDDSNGSNASVGLRVFNNKITTTDPHGSVRLIKHAVGDTGITLPGAAFRLERLTNSAWEEYATDLTTNAGGLIQLDGLAFGTYRFVETRAPYGYVLPSGSTAITRFTIDESNGYHQTLVLQVSNRRRSTATTTQDPKPERPQITVPAPDPDQGGAAGDTGSGIEGGGVNADFHNPETGVPTGVKMAISGSLICFATGAVLRVIARRED